MLTDKNENYGVDDRNFYQTEHEISLNSEEDSPDLEDNESYVDHYQEENDLSEENLDYLDQNFEKAIERDDFENEDLNENDSKNDPEEDSEEDLDENDLDDDLVEKYDENDHDIDQFATDKVKTDSLDQEFDIDQDLEEVDPVNHPREFDL